MAPDVVQDEPGYEPPISNEPAFAEPAYADEGYETTRTRRAPWIVAVAALAAAALLLFIVLNQRSDPTAGGDHGKGATGTTTAGGAAVVPSGWETYTDDTVGYEISYPPGWTVAPGAGNTTDFSDPESGTYLRVDWTSTPGDSPEGAWESLSQSFGASHENYEELRIDPTTFRGWDAAEWEYTYTDGGADLHAIDLGFVTGDYGFALNFQTHAENWDSSQDIFESFKSAFKPPQ
jgi:hypothetical protein